MATLPDPCLPASIRDGRTVPALARRSLAVGAA